MLDLLTICRTLITQAISDPSGYVPAFPEHDPVLRAAITDFRGVKTDIRSDLSPESLQRLKASLILSDFTSVFLGGGKDMTVLMAAGQAPHWPSEVRIPLEVLQEIKVALKDGIPMVFPGHAMRFDDQVQQFLREVRSLTEAGRLLLRPLPVLLVYPEELNEKGGRDIRMLEVEPNTPDAAWIYRDSQETQSALPLFESPPGNPATEICTISVPYIEGVSFPGTLPLILCDRKRTLLPVSFDFHIKRAGGVPMRKPSNWGQPCPNPECPQYSLLNRGNVKALSTDLTRSGKRRIFQCTRCQTAFSETRDTVFFDLRTPEEKVMMALKMLLVKVDLAGISFVLGVTEETTLAWLRRAAQQAAVINAHLLRELPVTQVQLDEMWTFVTRKHATEAERDGARPATSADGQQWIWVSYAPEWRLMLATVVGPRTARSALTLMELTAAMIVGVPCFFSDGCSSYGAALLAIYHQVKTFVRTGQPGRPRVPIWEPHPDLVYG